MRGSNTQELPWWLTLETVEFHEDGDEDDDDSEEESDDDDEETSDDDDDDEEEDDDSDGKKGKAKGKKDDPNSTENLLKALREERKNRKKFERDLKKLQKAQSKKGEEEESELTTTKAELATASTKVGKLSELLTKSIVDTAIIKAATTERFRDIGDALSLVDRSSIDFELDIEDDDVEMEFDEASVVAAVKKLAETKPHLIIADGDGEASGGKGVGGKKKKKDDALSEEALRERYPMLRP